MHNAKTLSFGNILYLVETVICVEIFPSHSAERDMCREA